MVPVSQFPDWPTKLVEALCQDPSLANKPNQMLVSAIEARSGKTGFNSKLISKKLSALQHSYVSDVLRQHGYSPATLVTGTDIKHIVRDQVRVGTTGAAATEVHTEFLPDGLSLDGRTYQYRQRNTTPTGNPWYDFCVRIGGVETPLYTVLVLRNVGIGEFKLRDEAAMQSATPEQRARRQELDRESKEHRRLAKLLEPAEAANDPKKEVPAEYEAYMKSVDPWRYRKQAYAPTVTR